MNYYKLLVDTILPNGRIQYKNVPRYVTAKDELSARNKFENPNGGDPQGTRAKYKVNNIQQISKDQYDNEVKFAPSGMKSMEKYRVKYNFSERINKLFSKSVFLIINNNGSSFISDDKPSYRNGDSEFIEFPDKVTARKYDELTRAWDHNLDNKDTNSNKSLEDNLKYLKSKIITQGYI